MDGQKVLPESPCKDRHLHTNQRRIQSRIGECGQYQTALNQHVHLRYYSFVRGHFPYENHKTELHHRIAKCAEETQLPEQFARVFVENRSVYYKIEIERSCALSAHFSVSSMHAWPQVMSMWSYLVDMVDDSVMGTDTTDSNIDQVRLAFDR